MKPLIICLILMAVLVGTVTAITTDAVTGNTLGNIVTFNSHGGVAPCWYLWGEGDNYYWTTPQQNSCGSDYQYGSPMLTGETYNVKACDSTGCDINHVSWTVPNVRLMNRTNFGAGVMTIWRSGFNVTQVSNIIIRPYVDTLTGVITDLNVPAAQQIRDNAQGIIIGMLFFMIYVGYWLRGQGIGLPCFMSILSFTVIFGANQLGAGVPSEFQRLGYALLVVGVTGLIYSWISDK